MYIKTGVANDKGVLMTWVESQLRSVKVGLRVYSCLINNSERAHDRRKNNVVEDPVSKRALGLVCAAGDSQCEYQCLQ